MPVSDFFSSIADKAQTAINQTPLAGHIPGTFPANDHPQSHATQQAGHRSLALESLQHTFRNIGQQYTSTTPLQRIITLEKGVALDYDAVARDSKAQSKELYTWGQNEAADLKDVMDRLAYLNFVHGSLSGSAAVTLNSARAPLKALRDAEAALTPKRNIRAGLRNQIARVEHQQEKGGERRLTELKEQLARAEANDEQLEKELELSKRKAIRDGEQRKWDAIREYGEKLVLLSQAANPIIDVLPTLPPTEANPYRGEQATAAARAALQQGLDNYKLGQVDLHLQVGADLSRSDTRSFGETHASELGTLSTLAGGEDMHPGLSVTPPVPDHPPNQTPVPDVTGVSQYSNSNVGIPIKSHSEDLYDTPVRKSESADEEKRRLEREEKERVLGAGVEAKNDQPSGSESAEDEKKRLEKEERERVLAGGADPKDGDELPPYKDIQ